MRVLRELDELEASHLRAKDYRLFTLEDACALYLIYIKNKLKLSTFVDKMRFLERNFLKLVNRDQLVISFSQKDADTFREKVLALTKVAYKNRVLDEVKRCFIYFEKYFGYRCSPIFQMLPINISYHDLKPKKINIYTINDFKQFISVVNNLYEKCLFEVLFFLGLRVGELRGLKWSDLDGNKLSILRTCTSKLGRGFVLLDPKTKTSIRTLTIPEFLREDLQQLKSKQEPIKEFIFAAKSDKWQSISETTIAKLAKQYAAQSGLPYIHPHLWRHSCATYLVAQCGANIYQVKEWMGHSSAEVTSRIYVHLYSHSLDDLAHKIEEDLKQV